MSQIRPSRVRISARGRASPQSGLRRCRSLSDNCTNTFKKKLGLGWLKVCCKKVIAKYLLRILKYFHLHDIITKGTKEGNMYRIDTLIKSQLERWKFRLLKKLQFSKKKNWNPISLAFFFFFKFCFRTWCFIENPGLQISSRLQRSYKNMDSGNKPRVTLKKTETNINSMQDVHYMIFIYIYIYILYSWA